MPGAGSGPGIFTAYLDIEEASVFELVERVALSGASTGSTTEADINNSFVPYIRLVKIYFKKELPRNGQLAIMKQG